MSNLYILDASSLFLHGLISGSSYGSYREFIAFLSDHLPIKSYYWIQTSTGKFYIIESDDEAGILLGCLALERVKFYPLTQENYQKIFDRSMYGRFVTDYSELVNDAMLNMRDPRF